MDVVILVYIHIKIYKMRRKFIPIKRHQQIKEMNDLFYNLGKTFVK